MSNILVLLQRDRELRLIEPILCAGHKGPFTLVVPFAELSWEAGK